VLVHIFSYSQHHVLCGPSCWLVSELISAAWTPDFIATLPA